MGIKQIGIYVIHRLLGDGASSVVFKGWDPKLERWVAVRVLKPHLAKVPTARTRFLAENRAGSSVVHPNVLSVYEVHDHDEWPYAILAYNDGETLADLCESGHEFTFEEICQIGLAMAKGLDAIHDADFIHGDLKPSNALIEHSTKVVRLTDFGAPAGQGATPLYQSPEQVDKRSLDHRTDLFSMGVILYRLTLGKLPYQNRRGEALANEISSEPPPSIPRSAAPTWLRQLTTSLLAKNPSQRPASARAVVEGFESQAYHAKADKRSRLPTFGIAASIVLMLFTLGFAWHFSQPSRGMPVYIEGSRKSYENLAIAIAEAAPGATVVLRDGVHELPGETTLFHAIRFTAEEGAQPTIRSRDTTRGTLFNVKASTSFQGITLSHVMANTSKSGFLVGGTGPLTFDKCRLEQVWKGSPRVSPRPSVIRTFAPVTLRHTEIDATATIAISSRLDHDGQTGTVIIQESAIAAQTAFYLHAEGHPGTYEISLSKSHLLAGTVCTIAEETAARPRWEINDSVLEADTMIATYQKQSDLEDTLKKLSWKGQTNFYWFNHFLRTARTKAYSSDKTRSLEGWLSLCSQANEIDPHVVSESILKPERPIASEDIPSWMRRFSKTTAWDLRIQHPVVHRRYPNHGGNMALVGPLAAH